MTTATQRSDLSDPEFWRRPPEERLEHFRWMRAEDPVSWHGESEAWKGRGFWVVVRYDDVRTVSRDAETFCSGQGVVLLEEDPTAEALGVQSFLIMAEPDHARLRGLVQKAFSPRQVALIDEQIKANARMIVSELEAHETGDFVDRVAKRLPLLTICGMLGVPESEHERILTNVDTLVSAQDPDFLQGRDPLEVLKAAMIEVGMHAFQMAQHRREHPADDLLGALVEAEHDGHRLSDAEIAQFLMLLSVAGNDTTRNTTSHAVRALSEFPDQRAILIADLDATLPVAIDEFVRWASPVMHFKRTATRDTVIGEQPIKQGEEVAMIYSSANRDERAFEDADHFDVTRSPNRHVGFGGGGAHFCMGAVLARTQLRALFTELLSTFPDIQVGEPRYITGNFMNAIKELPMDTGRRAG
ncbi:MAG: cytochrome P450 [Solirubrobacteraceae bacterium]